MADILVYINVGVLLVALAIATYYLFLHKPSKKPVPKLQDRRDEIGELSVDQKFIYDQAEELAKEGHILSAAKMMESLGVTRRAVDLLEEYGHIGEATNILLRIHSPNRAAAIYEHHGYWLEAIDCHKIYKNYVKAAQVYETNVGDTSSAAYYYELAKDNINAARCYEKSGQIREAIACHINNKDWGRGVELASSIFSQVTPECFFPNKTELLVLEKAVLKNHNIDPEFLEVLSRENRLHQVILIDLLDDRLDRAKKCIPYLGENATSTLIGMAVQKEVAERLIQCFTENGALENAGDTMERLGLRDKACEFYEEHQMYERAVNMYDSTDPKGKDLMEKLVTQLKARQTKQKASQGDSTCVSQPLDFVTYRLRKAFNNASVVSQLKLAEKDGLWAQGSLQKFKKGDVIASASEQPADKLCIILEGTVVAQSTLPQIGEPLGVSSSLESHNVLTGGSFTATYTAKEDCTVWQVAREAQEQWLAEREPMRKKMLQTSFGEPAGLSKVV
jgi:tetratricopeptide (TPR) repeat protein